MTVVLEGFQSNQDLLMMDLDTPETCRGWRNVLHISWASSCFSFTRCYLEMSFILLSTVAPSKLVVWLSLLLYNFIFYSMPTSTLRRSSSVRALRPAAWGSYTLDLWRSGYPTPGGATGPGLRLQGIFHKSSSFSTPAELSFPGRHGFPQLDQSRYCLRGGLW